MKINYRCPWCDKDTQHKIQFHVHESEKQTISQVQCIVCMDKPIQLIHETGKLPLYDSKRVLYPCDENERGKKEVRTCKFCGHDRWGREIIKDENDERTIMAFSCFTCTKNTDITIPKKQTYG